MVEFNKIKQLFPKDKYQCGVLSAKDTYQLGQVRLRLRSHIAGTLLFHPRTKKLWKTIKNSLIILQYNTAAYDYSIKSETKKILRLHFRDIILLTLDLKTAACRAGLASRGYNSLAWSPHFGFDCKITAWGFFENIVGYQRPRLPEWLSLCKSCFKCHYSCPAQAFFGNSIKDFKFNIDKCRSVIGKQAYCFAVEENIVLSGWNGVQGGIPKFCRVCQEQLPCKVAKHKTYSN